MTVTESKWGSHTKPAQHHAHALDSENDSSVSQQEGRGRSLSSQTSAGEKLRAVRDEESELFGAQREICSPVEQC